MVNPNRTKISETIEVDECCIGGEEHDSKRGRGATENKSLLVVGVALLEDRNQRGRVRLKVVPDVSGESPVESFIKENAEPGSTVITDGWCGFSSVDASGYAHIVPQKYAVADPKNLLPRVHRIVSLRKRRLLGTHQGAVQTAHLHDLLAHKDW
jgi:hypothetical protein